MSAISRWTRRIWYFLNRRRLEQDLEREMASHRALMGDPRRFGNAIRLREQNADVWGWTWLDDLGRDVRHGVRHLVAAPRWTAPAIAILALGAGVPLTILHFANAIGSHMFAVPGAASLVRVSGQSPRFPARVPAAAATFYRQHQTTFSFLVGEYRGWRVSLDDDPAPLTSVFVSSDYFQHLRVAAVHGRLLEARDSEPSAPPVAVLGHAYWQRSFGGDPGVIDRVVRLNGVAVRLVGVLPGDFDGLGLPPTTRAAVWFPFALRPQIAANSPPLDDVTRADVELYGRLKPGVSHAAAASQLETLSRELRRQQGGRDGSENTLGVAPLMEGPRFEADVAVMVVLFFLIFFSASANLGNMLLARGIGRAREIDLRLSLGASHWRVVRQLLAENLVLALLGCAAATGVGYASARLIVRYAGDLPAGLHVTLDWRTLAASLALVALAVLGFGLAPSIHAVRRRRTPTRVRQGLVAVQVAASCVLLILAALLTRGADRLRTMDPALDYRRTIVLDPQLGERQLTPAARRATLNAAAAQLEGLAGVDAVAAAAAGRFGRGRPRVLLHEVSPRWFAALRLPLVRGRLFVEDEPGTVVVSESAARTVWPGRDPLGQTWSFGGDRVVVGVVGDSGLAARDGGAVGEAYIPMSEGGWSRAVLFAHTSGDARTMLRAASAAMTASGLRSTATLMADTLSLEPRSSSVLIGILGSVATLLAFTGIFGLMAFAVVQRTREIGVRMALGATRGDVLATLVTHYATPLLGGAASGVALALGAAQVLRNQLYGLPPLDPVSHAAGLVTFALVALAAILLPARRALRINPASALRCE